MSNSAVAAHTSSHSVLRWPALVVALFLATDSAHSTITEYLVTPFARTAFLVGIGVGAVGWTLILQLEQAYLQKARAALPFAEFRRHPAPIAARLCRSILFRWSVLFCISVVAVEYVLDIIHLRPGTGPLAGFTALALAATALVIHRGVLWNRGDVAETPEPATRPNVALSHPVRSYGSMVFLWGVWTFGWLVFVTGCLKALSRW